MTRGGFTVTTNSVPSRNRGGRIPKLTTEVAGAIERAVRAGVPLNAAAWAAGVAPSTVFRWLARGRRERTGQYCEFRTAVKKAEADAIAGRLQRVLDAADRGTWQAAAWWLERRHPEHFSSFRRELRELYREYRELLASLKEQGFVPDKSKR